MKEIGENKKWEVTIIELDGPQGKRYKVTRRVPEMGVAETKFFATLEEARSQFEEWLH